MGTEQRATDESWREPDRILAETESSFDFLSAVSPEELDPAWERFRAGGCSKAPELKMPRLEIDPRDLRNRIKDLDLKAVEDHDIQFLLAGKQDELHWQLTMLELRDSVAFLTRSMVHYGPVSRELHNCAREILDELPVEESGESPASTDAVMSRAQEEVQSYRRQDKQFDAEVEQQEDAGSLQASHGKLLIPDDIELPPQRLEALAQHEIGAHVVTHYNGQSQPLQVLRNGLSDYDELQESFGVIAEFFADGLTSTRLRTLATRVMAVHALEDGADFIETFRLLDEEYDVGPYNAFDTTARIFAGGGFTRDQIYLRGLVWLLRYFEADGDLEPLYVGKIGPDQVPAVLRLRRRGFLLEPPLKPNFLQGDTAERKLDALRTGLLPLDLVTETR